MPSLRIRFLFVAALILAVFSMSAGWILRQSFEASIQDRAQEQLKLQIYGMLAAAEFKDGQLQLPQLLSEPRFNRLQSGLFALVFKGEDPVWYSQSYLLNNVPPIEFGQPGRWNMVQYETPDKAQFYQLSFTVLWEHQGKDLPFTFVVWESDQPYVAQIQSFEATLWAWLGGLEIVSIALVFFLLNIGFRPFRKLARELSEVENGARQQLVKIYPVEVMPVVRNLNRLIEHERQVRERYKHSLGDLAHSLKTPLAVLKGVRQSINQDEESDKVFLQQIERMDEIVNYQLRRAISAVPNRSAQGAVLLSVYHKMATVLGKVYAEKAIEFEQDIRPGLRLPWDEADSLEVLGNLMDNACKFGASRVKVRGWIANGALWITVDDDGPGIAKADRNLVLRRGARKDEQVAGQGIGLAIVTDIVENSEGDLSIEASEAGGARFLIRLDLGW
ncbi:hypothetical protein FT643_01720 [Ketobacter sp. MCCC 1A13808]|uniref:ATP-binding protein n=1 Tax=Ketobacter sp. MCCC 1A13808 TaxID=2602738 RepID=UPI0012EC5066|nr:ATP-binding protein [Ketobacter sp. MCCC 1A13808]MVF10848.1 hypothetical protein [Ketobacter sp. MCCC 1A13808]